MFVRHYIENEYFNFQTKYLENINKIGLNLTAIICITLIIYEFFHFSNMYY